MSFELIETARRLCDRAGRPRQQDLRRAISTAYYAVFHELAKQSADMLVGGTNSKRSKGAWVQVYRSLDHGRARRASQAASNLSFPKQLLDFADSFIQLQEQRHSADYDPSKDYLRADALLAIERADLAIRRMRSSQIKHRRAFAVWVLFQKR